MSEWIPIIERLPDCEGWYLICNIHGLIYIKFFKTDNEKFIFYDDETYCYCPVGEVVNVTHWSKLPKVPEVRVPHPQYIKEQSLSSVQNEFFQEMSKKMSESLEDANDKIVRSILNE